MKKILIALCIVMTMVCIGCRKHGCSAIEEPNLDWTKELTVEEVYPVLSHVYNIDRHLGDTIKLRGYWRKAIGPDTVYTDENGAFRIYVEYCIFNDWPEDLGRGHIFVDLDKELYDRVLLEGDPKEMVHVTVRVGGLDWTDDGCSHFPTGTAIDFYYDNK